MTRKLTKALNTFFETKFKFGKAQNKKTLC